MTNSERYKTWAQRNREHLREYQRRWKEKNRDKIRAYNRKHYKYDKAKARDIALRRKFGINTAQYEVMREAQKNRCAVCRTAIPGGKGDWHVDHDHATGAIRGLLCQNCNLGLGHFQDSPRFLAAAIKYLQKHKKQSKLKTNKESSE